MGISNWLFGTGDAARARSATNASNFQLEGGGMLRGLIGGQLGGVGVMADPAGPERGDPGDNETAGHHGVAGCLQDRVRLPGEQGFVHLEVGRLDPQRGVCLRGANLCGADLFEAVEEQLGPLPIVAENCWSDHVPCTHDATLSRYDVSGSNSCCSLPSAS